MTKIFISYSSEDKCYKEEISKWLNLLEDTETTAWEDSQIKPGQLWHNVIQGQLAECNIILLLISIDFLVSKYIKENELQQAIKKAEEGKAIVIPIFIRETFLKRFEYITVHQGLPKGKTIANSTDKDNAYTEIITGINRVIAEMNPGVTANKEVIDNFENRISSKSLEQIKGSDKIYLASASGKMKEVRNSIFYELVGKKQYVDWKYDVIPTPQQLDEIEKLPKDKQIEAIQELLNESLLSIHVVDESEPDEKIKAFQLLQLQQATNKCATSNFKCLVRRVVPKDSSDVAPSENTEVLDGKFTTRDEIIETMNDQLDEMNKRMKQLENIIKDKRNVYLLFDSTDLDHPCLPVVKQLLDVRVCVETALTLEGKSNEVTIAEYERNSISANDGVVIFYGKSSRNWVLTRQREVIKYNKRNKCIVVTEPETKKSLNLDIESQFNPILSCPGDFNSFFNGLYGL